MGAMLNDITTDNLISDRQDKKWTMGQVLKIIGGATTLLYTVIDDRHAKTGNTKHIVGGQLVEKINGLAICRYDNDPGYYLFGCNNNWDSITDTYHDSIDDAKEQAEFEYTNTLGTWTEMQSV